MQIERQVSGNLQVQIATVPEMGEQCFALKVSPDGKFIAGTFGSGVIRLMDSNSLECSTRTKLGTPYDDLPSTAVKFGAPTGPKEDQYSIVSTSSAGAVFGWTWDGRDYIERVFRIPEEKNDTSALDFSYDGRTFVTAGCDRNIRLYDFAEQKCIKTMHKGVDENGHPRVAHPNRIFSARFASPTTILTGGWECPVQVWDLRVGNSVRQVSGPQVGADCIEPIPNTTRFYSASNRGTKQLQVFDYIGCREIEEEGAKLNQGIGRDVLAQVRLSAAGTLWTFSGSSRNIYHIDAKTGKMLDVFTSPVPVLALEVSPHYPHRCYAACAKETIIILDAVR
jgi:WD40 repeat protein